MRRDGVVRYKDREHCVRSQERLRDEMGRREKMRKREGMWDAPRCTSIIFNVKLLTGTSA